MGLLACASNAATAAATCSWKKLNISPSGEMAWRNHGAAEPEPNSAARIDDAAAVDAATAAAAIVRKGEFNQEVFGAMLRRDAFEQNSMQLNQINKATCIVHSARAYYTCECAIKSRVLAAKYSLRCLAANRFCC